MTNPLYAVRSLEVGKYQLAKFTPDFVVEATYNLEKRGHSYTCDCPASYRGAKLKPCKHQRMLPYMLGAMNLPRFFDPETGNWHGLIDVAPGMKQEHEDGEAVVPPEAPQVQKGVADPEHLSELKSDESLRHIAENTYNGDGTYGEPAASHGVNASEQNARVEPTPASQPPPPPKRSMAPASAAPVVTRRI